MRVDHRLCTNRPVTTQKPHSLEEPAEEREGRESQQTPCSWLNQSHNSITLDPQHGARCNTRSAPCAARCCARSNDAAWQRQPAARWRRCCGGWTRWRRASPRHWARSAVGRAGRTCARPLAPCTTASTPAALHTQGGDTQPGSALPGAAAGGWGSRRERQPLGKDANATEQMADKAADVMEDAAADAVQKLHPALIKFLNR